jgi:hypothetical protein
VTAAAGTPLWAPPRKNSLHGWTGNICHLFAFRLRKWTSLGCWTEHK